METLPCERTEDVKNVKGIMFESMGLSTELLVGIRAKKFYIPSPIQEEAIPIILKNCDVLARAKNGTGKTATFLIPIIQRIDQKKSNIQSIIIVPTRELALQTCNTCMELAQFTHVKVYPLTGGTKISEDVENIRNKAQILITTPGRITDFCTRNLIDISQTSTICIDEADSIIRNGQNPIIDSILSKIPTKCQFLLFSATFPRVIASFRDKYMKNTVEINTMKEFTLKGVTQFYAFTEEKDKISCVYTLLSKLQINQCIIFCNSINRVRLLTEKLMGLSMSCRSIHSKMPQSERVSIFEDFKLAKFRILVCTDVFNRGIDIQAVNVVINFDLPTKSATYLHRIGRSGRFGHIGIGISFVSDHDKEDFLRISKELSTNINPIPKNAEISKNLYVSNIPVQ